MEGHPGPQHVSPGRAETLSARMLDEFVALHGPALRSSGVPERLWGRLLHKLEHEVFDAGEIFGIMQVQEVEEAEDEAAREAQRKQPNPGSELCYKVIVTCENGVQADDPNSIFLIDHAWTCRVEHARKQLQQVPGLLHRMANLMGIEFHGEVPSPEAVGLVLEEMWKFNQTYQLAHGTAEEKVPVWYIMDEFGSRIQHSDVPSFATAPFFYMPQQVAYTLLWPLRDLDTGGKSAACIPPRGWALGGPPTTPTDGHACLGTEEVTRDFAYGEADPLIRKCMLLPWAPADMLDLRSSTPEPPAEYYQAILKENKEKLPLAISPVSQRQGHIFRVHTDMQQVLCHLTHPRFAFTESEADSDILYHFSHFKDYRKLSEERPQVLLNQFPCENLLTVKDCLASIARRAGGPEGPPWLPRTFNLLTELPQFVSCFQHRERRGDDNHWICKPWNLARSLDTHVTNNLHSIIRHRESTPKVVSKYIESPVLFLREDVGTVKFDIRYVVLLRSVKPLRLCVYDVFWLRFSNRPFALNDLDDYEKHFTVMNYDLDVVLKQVHYNEFIPQFEKQYPEFPWNGVQAEIFKAFTELFQVACAKPPPMGLCDYPSSRAIYAIDLMLKWDSHPDGKGTCHTRTL
ncbi:tubulin--tyrosine ligase-like protein 12 [Acomys russatus]|uniref:tubulin--tyrosine ligase-like protein 12 n=1 Tax=Acomys russatus TaxID=60746 RepID=UPI0021E2655E|nr:tubulin--tyrosine ligase-like protein 12 [Acomys russatus]